MLVNKVISTISLIVHIIGDILIPRFIEERVALVEDSEGNLIVLCRECEVTPEDTIKIYGVNRGFNLFGFSLFNKVTLD
jgi:hypothetical protein